MKARFEKAVDGLQIAQENIDEVISSYIKFRQTRRINFDDPVGDRNRLYNYMKIIQDKIEQVGKDLKEVVKLSNSLLEAKSDEFDSIILNMVGVKELLENLKTAGENLKNRARSNDKFKILYANYSEMAEEQKLGSTLIQLTANAQSAIKDNFQYAKSKVQTSYGVSSLFGVPRLNLRDTEEGYDEADASEKISLLSSKKS